MNVLLAIVGLPMALVLPGLVTLVAFLPRRQADAIAVGDTSILRIAAVPPPRPINTPRDGPHLDWLEWLYLTLALSLVLSGWVGLVLAQIGIFSAGLLVGLLAAYTVVVAWVGWRRGRGGMLRRPLLSPLPPPLPTKWGGEGVSPSRSSERVRQNAAAAGVGRGWRTRLPTRLGRWARQNVASLLFLLLSVLFIALAFRPFEMILGPRDAAVYPATAAQIARHGGIRIADPILATLPDPALSDENNRLWTSLILLQSAGRFYYHYLRMPGFFIAEADVDRQVPIPEFIPDTEGEIVVPQFYHLYPTWLAIAFSFLGIQAGLLMTPYLSLLGGVGVFLLVRRLLGAPAALLAALFLNLNVVQVWFARYSTAEGATQFLLFLCLYAFVRLEEDEQSRREPFWGLLVGVPLGMLGLVRVEFIFPWLLFLPYLAYLYVTRGLRRGHRALLLALGALVLHTVAQFIFYTRAYTLAIYYHEPIQKSFVLSWLIYPFMTPTLRLYFYESATSRTHVMKEPWRLLYELGVPLLLAAALVLLRRRPAWVARIGAWFRRHGRLLLTAAAVLVTLALAYTYLVRPGILTPEVLLHPVENNLALQGYIGAPVPTGPAANLVRLGWYFSPLGMGLVFAGIALFVIREGNRRTWFLTLLGLFYLALFTYQTFGMDHHVYIMRRYVAMVVPFFCIAAAYALAWLGRWLPGGLRAPAPPAAGSLHADCSSGGRSPPAPPLRGPAAPSDSPASNHAAERNHAAVRTGLWTRKGDTALGRNQIPREKKIGLASALASARERFYAGGPGDCKSPGGVQGQSPCKELPPRGRGGKRLALKLTLMGQSPPAESSGGTECAASAVGAAGRRIGPPGLARRAAAAALALFLCAYLAYTGLPFFRHNEYQGAFEQVGALAERFEPEDVILAVGAGRDAPFTIVTPLRYIFERHAFGVVSDPPAAAQLEAQIRQWQAEGRRVYLLVGNGGGRLFLPHTRLNWLGRFELAVPEFEHLTAQKPHNAYILRQPWGIYEPVPWTGMGSALADLPLEIDLGSGGYIFQAGGFYGDETDPDGTTYCWTTGQGSLRLPWPQEGVVTLALRLAGGKRPADLGPAVVQLRGEQYLFDGGLDAAAALDQGEVSAGLREQFRAAGHPLSPRPPGVEVQQSGRAWAIVDEDATYLVRSGGQGLLVYGEQVLGSWKLGADFATYTLVVPAEVVTPDESGTVLLSIVSPAWKQVDYGLGSDVRPLGVEVDWVRVGRGER